MKLQLASLSLGVVLAVSSSIPAPAQLLEEQAAAILDQIANAYQRVSALSDSVTVTTRRGDAIETEAFKYTLGSKGEATFVGPRYTAVAGDGKLLLAKNTVGRKYLETDIGSAGTGSNLFSALGGLLGQEDLPPLPQFEMRAGGSVASYLDVLRMGMLGPLTVESTGSVAGSAGREIHQLVLVADNGRVVLAVRPQTFLLVALELEFAPDSETGQGMSLTASFDPIIHDHLISEKPVLEIEGRKRMRMVTELEQTRLELGEPLPEVVLPTLKGRNIPTSALRGTAAILVFWSEDCEPCIEDLARAEKLVEWAKQEDLAVRVILVNTLDDFESPTQGQEAIQDRVEKAGFSQMVFWDLNHELFISMGIKHLPSTVAVNPGGFVAGYFEGLGTPNIERIKTLLKEPPAS